MFEGTSTLVVPYFVRDDTKKTRNDHYSFDSCQFSHQIPPYLWNGVYFCRRRNFYNISYRIDHSIHLNHINAYQKSSCVKWYGLAVYWLLTFSYFCNVFANLNSFLIIIELEFRIKNKYKWLCVSLRSNTRSDEFMPGFFNMPNKDSHIQFDGDKSIFAYLFVTRPILKRAPFPRFVSFTLKCCIYLSANCCCVFANSEMFI